MSKISSCLACCCCFPCFLFLLVLSLGIPSFLMFMGISRMDHCPIEPHIPIWLICVSSLIFLQILLESVRPIRDRSMKSVQDCSIDCCSCLSLLLYFSRLALFAATILGCVLVFSIVPIQNQCDTLLYWTSFIYCILALISYVIASIFWICCCCFIVVGGYQGVPTNVRVTEHHQVLESEKFVERYREREDVTMKRN